MSFPYARIILEDCEYPVFLRGKDLATSGKVSIASQGTAACRATAQGSQPYEVRLGFSRVGSPKHACTCPYVTQHKTKLVCKHIVAAALLWDAERGVEPPTDETAKSLCLQEPELPYADIRKAYADPIKADLDILRDTSEKLGSWSRPHSHLPALPKVCTEPVLTPAVVREGLAEIRKWSQRSSFDPYFCAGEVMAAFCGLIRWAKPLLQGLPEPEQGAVLRLLVAFQRKIILEMIDDSDGLHEFSQAHLLDLCKSFAGASYVPDLAGQVRTIE